MHGRPIISARPKHGAPLKQRRGSINLIMALVVLSSIAAPTAFAADAVALKRTVAVARFSNETRSGQSFLVDDSGDRIGKQAADILSARLASTDRFLMFERLDVDDVSAEQTLAGLQEQGVAVDYLIVGSVSEFGRSTESDTGIFSRAKIQKAYAKVNVRLIEVDTGRIIFANEGAGEATTETKKTFGVGSSAGFDQSLTDQAISAAISQLVSNLVENMTNKPWRSYVLGMDNGMYMIAGGTSQGLQPGAELFVYRAGREVRNPQTGATIALPGTRIGTLRVVQSIGEDEFNELSFAELVNGTIGESYDELYISNE
ncbi:MAG TPA: CsgG/HfaB family protein [Pseudomonadales bacterium]|nr:CsgG/HfaB family protein [Pseudomonadales bacterium]